MPEPEKSQIERKKSEFRTLSNRVHRYWKKLILEGIKEARDCGIETIVTEDHLRLRRDVVVSAIEGKIDPWALINYARDKFPLLYRKYYRMMPRYNELSEEIISFCS